jgi:hypothetical protein
VAAKTIEASLLDPQVVRVMAVDPKMTLFLNIERSERRPGVSRIAQQDLMRDSMMLGRVELETDDGHETGLMRPFCSGRFGAGHRPIFVSRSPDRSPCPAILNPMSCLSSLRYLP